MKIQLSISLLVSDRSDVAERCLSSLVPLLEGVACELIVVYTGEGKKNLTIAKKYTDHIISFPWCDDFSAARNAGLKEARGEWFLYLDDDEWFEDCSEIVSFFQSGEYKKYQSAFYRIRNYHDFEGKSYGENDASRMIRLTPERRFVGTIHESFDLSPPPVRYFQSFVHHFGYARKSLDEKNSRFSRNVPLLEKEIQRDPNNIRCYIQLAQEYLYHRELDRGEYYCKKAIDVDKRYWVSGCHDWAQVVLMEIYMDQGNSAKALDLGERLLKEKEISELASLYICLHLMAIYRNFGRYEDGLRSAEYFLTTYEIMDSQPELWRQQQVLFINQERISVSRFQMYQAALVCGAQLKDYNAVIRYLNCFPWGGSEMDEDFYRFFEEWKSGLTSSKREILWCFSKVEGEDTYLYFQKALLAEMNCDWEDMRRLYRLAAVKENQLIVSCVVGMAIRNDLELPDFVRKMDLERWKDCAREIAADLPPGGYSEYKRRIGDCFRGQAIHREILDQMMIVRYLMEECSGADAGPAGKESGEESFETLLRSYVDTVLHLNQGIYQDRLFREDMRFCLPVECRVALMLKDALDLLDKGQVAAGIQALKKVILLYSDTSKLVSRLLKMAENDMAASQVNKQEVRKLGEQVKTVLRQLMEARRYEEAYPIAEKLCKLMPDDLEVVKWKQNLLTLM